MPSGAWQERMMESSIASNISEFAMAERIASAVFCDNLGVTGTSFSFEFVIVQIVAAVAAAIAASMFVIAAGVAAVAAAVIVEGKNCGADCSSSGISTKFIPRLK